MHVRACVCARWLFYCCYFVCTFFMFFLESVRFIVVLIFFVNNTHSTLSFSSPTFLLTPSFISPTSPYLSFPLILFPYSTHTGFSRSFRLLLYRTYLSLHSPLLYTNTTFPYQLHPNQGIKTPYYNTQFPLVLKFCWRNATLLIPVHYAKKHVPCS